MSTELRQAIIALTNELPEEKLPEAIALLSSLIANGHQSTSEISERSENEADFDRAMAAYRIISKKYENALRELAK